MLSLPFVHVAIVFYFFHFDRINYFRLTVLNTQSKSGVREWVYALWHTIVWPLMKLRKEYKYTHIFSYTYINSGKETTYINITTNFIVNNKFFFLFNRWKSMFLLYAIRNILGAFIWYDVFFALNWHWSSIKRKRTVSTLFYR